MLGNGKFVGSAPRVSAVNSGLHVPFNSRLFAKSSDPSIRSAVFLDRDGVLVRDVHYLREPSQIEILPYVEQLRALHTDYYLIVATNQSGIARNFFTEEDLLAVHVELVERLWDLDIVIDAFYYCPHLPNAVNPTYSVACQCRKPGAGLLHRAAAEWAIDLESSYMIGDSLRDVETGKAAGVADSILLAGSNVPDQQAKFKTVPDLGAAVKAILGGSS